MLSKWRCCHIARFEQTGDTGDLSNKLHLVDKKNTKSDIWKYFALRFNVVFVSLLLNQGCNYFNAQL